MKTSRRRQASILIVDDEVTKRDVMADRLGEEGYAVDICGSAVEALPLLEKRKYDVVVTDVRMPGMDGMQFLHEIKKRDSGQHVIVMTAYGSVESAVEAMKQGAFDYLQKPFSTEELMLKLSRLFSYDELLLKEDELQRRLRLEPGATAFVGVSPAVTSIISKVHTLSSVDSSVLIQGESGTGKEQLARLIHETSRRAGGPFVAVSCATLPRNLVEAELFGHEAGAFTGASKRRLGRFELANFGTVFLDDVDDVPVEVQTHLLRVIQERTFERVGGEATIHVDIRLISATKKDLAELAREGVFREDLYYRLNVLPIQIPPLCERPEDIPVLCEHLLEKLSTKLNRTTPRLSPSVLRKLSEYRWPGNVRELENVLERIVALGDAGDLAETMLPSVMGSLAESPIEVRTEGLTEIRLEDVLADVERRLIQWALKKADGNLAQAASLLGLPRSTLQYKIEKQEKSG